MTAVPTSSPQLIWSCCCSANESVATGVRTSISMLESLLEALRDSISGARVGVVSRGEFVVAEWPVGELRLRGRRWVLRNRERGRRRWMGVTRWGQHKNDTRLVLALSSTPGTWLMSYPPCDSESLAPEGTDMSEVMVCWRTFICWDIKWCCRSALHRWDNIKR